MKKTFSRRRPIGAAAMLGLVALACDADPQASDPAAGPSQMPATSSVSDELREITRIPSPYARAAALSRRLSGAAAASVPEVEAILRRYPRSLGAAEFDLLVRFWSSHAPMDAARWAIGQSAPRYRLAAVETAIETWAAADPAAAVVAIETELETFDEDTLRVIERSLVEGWFASDREGLERYVFGLGTGVKRQRAVLAYAISIADADGTEALEQWAESLPGDDERYKTTVYRQTLSGLLWADPAAALRFCDRHCDGPNGEGLRNVLIRSRFRDGAEGSEMMAWVAAIPEDDERQLERKTDALRLAYRSWARQDTDAALAWMEMEMAREAAERPHWLSALYGPYARFLASRAPAEAIAWAERIENTPEREHLLVRIARYWRTRDADAVEAWLATAQISEGARAAARDTSAPIQLPNVGNERGG